MYEAVIGLEVHAELTTQSKIFCEAGAHFGSAPNTQVSPVSLGLPGALPVLNQQVLELAVMAGLATECEIAARTKFDRKHYFYPDLPKGYQITQYDFPIAQRGQVKITCNGQTRIVRLNRIHMEEDAGKLVHAGADRMSGSVYSLADYNRAGVPLIEIVSEPDLRTPEEARFYLETLRNILMAIGVCDGKMQEGSLRCDANISIRPVGTETLGTRVEIKNINSFKFLQKALEYEIQRQQIAVENNETIVQETRLWDEASNRTLSMRSKEEAHDYRYFPDPDLVWHELNPAWVEQIRERLPELPVAKQARYVRDYALSEIDATTLAGDIELSQFFDTSLAEGADAIEACKWLLGDIAAYLNQNSQTLTETRFSAAKLASLLALIAKGTLSGKMAKSLLGDLMTGEQDPESLAEAKGLRQISDPGALDAIISQVLSANPVQVEQFQDGNPKILGFLMGQVMKQTKGQADPGLANQRLREMLAQLSE